MVARGILPFLVGFLATASALRICHTNDFHAKYLEIGSSNVKCNWWDSVADECYSGIGRVATALSSFACDVKIQAGDWVQGSLLDTAFKQTIAIQAYKWINYDFATFGNHEFDYGNEHINDTIRQIAPRTTWISSNVFFEGQGMEDLPIVRWDNRHDICWVAVLTAETMVLSDVEDNVDMKDEAASLRKYIKKCDQQDRVVAITHQGYQNDLDTCRDVKEIDLIIGGHTHTNLDNGEYPVKVTRDDGSVCWVTQAYAHGRYVGVLDVEFDDAGVIHLPSSMYIPLDYRIKPDPEVLVKTQMFNLQVVKKVSTVVGTVTDDVIGGQGCRGPMGIPTSPEMGECSMGDLLCDAVIESYGKQPASNLPVVCLHNGGTLRNSFNKGPVTIRDVVNVLPFGNSLIAMKLKGSDIIESLKHGLGLFLGDNRGGFPGGLGNMVVTTTADGSKPLGEQVTIDRVMVGGVKLDENAEYTMLTNSYIAGGGDGYSWPTEGDDLGTLLREAVQAYLEAHDPYDPVTFDNARLIMHGKNAEAHMASAKDAKPKSAEEGRYEVEFDEEEILAEKPPAGPDDKCEEGKCRDME